METDSIVNKGSTYSRRNEKPRLEEEEQTTTKGILSSALEPPLLHAASPNQTQLVN